jgi:hypothetical protein
MKRALTVTESEDNSAILFSIFSIADNEYPCGKEGRMRFVDPECPEFSSFLIRIGLYDSTAEAKRAAELYASARDLVLEEWTIFHPEWTRDGEPNLEANALPAGRREGG